MRTNIVIDDKLMRDTLRATRLKTTREARGNGAANPGAPELRTLVRLKRQARIRRLPLRASRGAWRTDRNPGRCAAGQRSPHAIQIKQLYRARVGDHLTTQNNDLTIGDIGIVK